MRKKLSLVVLVMCTCLGAYAQVPPYQRSPWTTNTPGSINAFATNTTIRTNLHVTGPTDSRLFQINTTEFVFSNLNANLGPLGVFGQGKEYGTPANAASGYLQPYSANDGYTRIWNTGPFGIFFGVDNLTRMRLDSPGNLGIGGAPTNTLHVFGSATITNNILILNIVNVPLYGRGGIIISNNTTSQDFSAAWSSITNWTRALPLKQIGASVALGSLTLTNAGDYSCEVQLAFETSTQPAEFIAELYLDAVPTGLRTKRDMTANAATGSCTILGTVTAASGQVATVKVWASAVETFLFREAQFVMRRQLD